MYSESVRSHSRQTTTNSQSQPSPISSSGEIRCYRCGLLDHFGYDRERCGLNEWEVWCYKCDMLGHYANDPRCPVTANELALRSRLYYAQVDPHQAGYNQRNAETFGTFSSSKTSGSNNATAANGHSSSYTMKQERYEKKKSKKSSDSKKGFSWY